MAKRGCRVASLTSLPVDVRRRQNNIQRAVYSCLSAFSISFNNFEEFRRGFCSSQVLKSVRINMLSDLILFGWVNRRIHEHSVDNQHLCYWYIQYITVKHGLLSHTHDYIYKAHTYTQVRTYIGSVFASWKWVERTVSWQSCKNTRTRNKSFT